MISDTPVGISDDTTINIFAQASDDTVLRSDFEKTMYESDRLKLNAFLGMDHYDNMSRRLGVTLGPKLKYKLFKMTKLTLNQKYA